MRKRSLSTKQCEKCGGNFNPWASKNRFCSTKCADDRKRYLTGNPWKFEAPDCPRCARSDQCYLWDFEDTRWYCAYCHRLFDRRTGKDVGGQAELF